MQRSIYPRGVQKAVTFERLGLYPSRLECVEAPTSAIRAGSMTGGERRRLVKKKEFRVGALPHDRVLVAFE